MVEMNARKREKGRVVMAEMYARKKIQRGVGRQRKIDGMFIINFSL